MTIMFGVDAADFCHVNPQPKDILELKSALVKIWDELPQDAICKSIANFRKRLQMADILRIYWNIAD